MTSSRLSTSLCGIPLSNPILTASGTFGYGSEFASIVNLNAIGGIVVKGLSREEIKGNPEPRKWLSRSGWHQKKTNEKDHPLLTSPHFGAHHG